MNHPLWMGFGGLHQLKEQPLLVYFLSYHPPSPHEKFNIEISKKKIKDTTKNVDCLAR